MNTERITDSDNPDPDPPGEMPREWRLFAVRFVGAFLLYAVSGETGPIQTPAKPHVSQNRRVPACTGFFT